MVFFSYIFKTKTCKSELSVDVPIPLMYSIDDYCQRIIGFHNIPRFVETDLKEKLEKFVAAEDSKFSHQRFQSVLQDKVKTGALDVKNLCKKWSSAYCQEVQKYAAKPSASIDASLKFPLLYKKLIHSPSLNSILNVEHAYAMAYRDLVHDRDRSLLHLEKRQADEMSKALSGGIAGRPYSDHEINSLAQRHFESQEFESNQWEKELKTLRNEQKDQYHEWLHNIDEDPEKSMMKARSLSQSMAASSRAASDDQDNMAASRLEESFTIHLGAQLKTTHNLRIMSVDVLELCRHTVNFSSSGVVEPQRLQTALSLYSNKLCGLILLVDDRLNTFSGVKKDFASVCEQSTDFHFPELQDQLKEIERGLVIHNEERQRSLASDTNSLKSSSSQTSFESVEKKNKLALGSFYMTKHSNLSEVHVVFHLVSDDTLLADITSRHPVILGLRNILKACFKNDVHTLTIPLFLTLEMSEEMTIPWCMKRAELVFKCVKGFMMEMSTWADAESRTIQFVVPQSLSVDTFYMLGNMLPGIFRQSNPIVGNR